MFGSFSIPIIPKHLRLQVVKGRGRPRVYLKLRLK
jgi:hypothetical protein